VPNSLSRRCWEPPLSYFGSFPNDYDAAGEDGIVLASSGEVPQGRGMVEELQFLVGSGWGRFYGVR